MEGGRESTEEIKGIIVMKIPGEDETIETITGGQAETGTDQGGKTGMIGVGAGARAEKREVAGGGRHRETSERGLQR